MRTGERRKTVSGGETEKEQAVAYQRQRHCGFLHRGPTRPSGLLEGLSLKASLPFRWPGQGLCEKGKKGKEH